MIHDFLIIKDGLPLFVKNYFTSDKAFSQGDNLIMVSGFFSALNSFSDSFDDLGTISELKLSNNELKLSFLKDRSIPNLIYLATYDENSNAVNVQRTLRKISRSFLMKFNINEILNWNGRRNTFASFESILNKYIEEEKEEKEGEFKERVVKLIKNVENKLNEESSLLALKSEIKKPDNLPEYCHKVPRFTSSMKVNPRHYLTGESSYKVFYQINGKKTIRDITSELELEHKQVYNICKNLIKLGFVKLT
jgi:hypothetical protein